MTRRILIKPLAAQDLNDIFDYIAIGNPDAALRFFDATRQTIAKLAQTPGLGSFYRVNNPRLTGLRKWGVKGFEKYLIFYMFDDEILEVVRILSAKRDLPTIFEEDNPPQK